MKRDEAESIFGMVCALYDLHPERRAELATVWIPALEPRDATIVMAVVEPWTRGVGAPERMPTLPWFMQALSNHERKMLPAASAHDPLNCTVCSDTGMVAVGMNEYGEITGPCPSCDRGKRIEFPLDSVGPWGEDGFWRGRKWQAVGGDVVEILA